MPLSRERVSRGCGLPAPTFIDESSARTSDELPALVAFRETRAIWRNHSSSATWCGAHMTNVRIGVTSENTISPDLRKRRTGPSTEEREMLREICPKTKYGSAPLGSSSCASQNTQLNYFSIASWSRSMWRWLSEMTPSGDSLASFSERAYAIVRSERSRQNIFVNRFSAKPSSAPACGP